jgi:transcriptional regulator with XRE-family HTH domain
MEDVIIHLKQCRKDCGFTLRALAQKAGYPRASLHRLEHDVGGVAQALAILGRIAKALNMHPLLIVEYKDWPMPAQPCPCQGAGRAQEVSDGTPSP